MIFLKVALVAGAALLWIIWIKCCARFFYFVLNEIYNLIWRD